MMFWVSVKNLKMIYKIKLTVLNSLKPSSTRREHVTWNWNVNLVTKHEQWPQQQFRRRLGERTGLSVIVELQYTSRKAVLSLNQTR